MNGLHLTADLRGCPAGLAAMTAPSALRVLCLDAVREAGLSPVGELFHAFSGAGGVTGVVLLAESHLAVHTWPELGAVTLDAYVCNFGADNSARAQQLLDRLIAAFAPQQVERHRVLRGAQPLAALAASDSPEPEAQARSARAAARPAASPSVKASSKTE